jgi:NodT family efflux transporter outer membrane factor (OMF) lipoprotein
MRPPSIQAALLAAVLAGCAAAPSATLTGAPQPDRLTIAEMPPATAGTGAARDRAQSLHAAEAAREDWWTAFGGPRVDVLVRGALAGNPTVDAATATLRQARELTLAQSATLWPSASITAGAVQAHGANASVVNSGAPRSRSLLLSASYSPDLFGLGASNVASVRAQEDAARWQLEASRLSLEGAVLDALVAEKSAAQAERLTEQLARIDSELVTIVQSRESLGDVATSAVWAQKQQLHDHLAQLAAARLQTAQARDLLASLLGQAPADFVEPPLDFDELALPDVATRLPGDVVRRRPDVQAAAAQLRALDAAHRAAIAALFPQVTLGGDAGYLADTVRRLFDPANLVWDLSVSATQSLFDAGAQRHRSSAAEAAAQAQAAQYRAAVVMAFKDVADGLEAVQRDAQADVEAVERLEAASRQFEIAGSSYALGEISRQDLLAAQENAIQMQLLQVQARANRLVDTANVMVSLGGSNPDSPPTPVPEP